MYVYSLSPATKYIHIVKPNRTLYYTECWMLMSSTRYGFKEISSLSEAPDGLTLCTLCSKEK